jgi:transposase
VSIDERTDDELTDEMILRRVVGEFLGASREEIARRSGLSESAVSRFVHAKLKLSPDAHARLEEIVEELIKKRGIEIAHATHLLHLLDEVEAKRRRTRTRAS